VRAVTFDAGGTLLTPQPGVGEVYAEILARHHLTVAPALLNQRFRAAFKELTATRPRPVVNEDTERAFWHEVVRRSIAPECPENLIAQVFVELWEEFAQPRRWRVLPGVAEALAALAARKQFRVAVLSNWDARLHRVLDGFGWARQFERVFISSEIGAEKPDVRAFRAVEAALGLPASACLHLGDSYAHDYRAAQTADWQALLIASIPPAGDILINHLTHLTELPALLPRF
jgi:putative hydrolase of the HAD superfamily